MSVEWVRVGEVLELQRTPIEIELTESYKRIGIYSWGRGFLHRPETSGAEMGSLRYFTFPTGALMLSNIQAWEAAVAVTTEAEAGYVASNRFLPYVPDTERVDVRYLAHYFVSEVGLEKLRAASPGTQVRNRTLGKKLFEELEIPLPAIDEQRRIADYLDSFSRLRRHANDSLSERYLARLQERVWAGQSHRIGDLLSLERRPVQIQPGGIHTEVGVRSFGRGLFLKGPSTTEQIGTKRVFRIEPDDLVVSNIFAWEGAVGLADTRHDGTIGSHRFMTWVVRPEALDLVDRRYLSNYLVSAAGREELLRASPGSAGRNRTLSIKNFEALVVPLPAIGEQREFAAHLDRIHETSNALGRRNMLLDALLPAARNEIFTAMR